MIRSSWAVSLRVRKSRWTLSDGGWFRGLRLQVPLEEREYLSPTVDCLLRTVARAVRGEEAVTGAVVAVEVIGLAQALEHVLCTVDLVGRRRKVLVAEDPQERTAELLR